MENNWEVFLDDPSGTKESFFLQVRDIYKRLLRHLYNDPKSIPDFRLHFSAERMNKGHIQTGYPICTITANSDEIVESVVRNVSEIENFENSYTWFEDKLFIVFDFREDGISPLQFITANFCEEMMHQLGRVGISKMAIDPLLEPLIYSGVVKFFYGFYQLDINLIQVLSAMTYEGSYIDCTLLVPRFDSDELRTLSGGLDVTFREPVQFSIDKLRQVRKLVELSDKNLMLWFNKAGMIYGLTREDAHPNECKVRLWGHLSWTITYERTKKISYYGGRYHIHTARRATSDIFESFGRMKERILPAQQYRLEIVIRAAARQRHGTILMIGEPDNIASEAERLILGKSATGISTTDLSLNTHLIYYLTSIDGAILVDTLCNTSCIGAILDGDLVTEGSAARGARYNSTVNYVKRRSQLGQMFAGIVISEDGTVDAVTTEAITRLNLTD